MSGDTAVDGLVQILMGVASRYWQLVKIDGAGRRQVQEISAAKAFFVDVFPAIASGGGNGIADNTDRHPDAKIQLQLLQLSRDASADRCLLAQRCLLCFISWQIEQVCLQLAANFGSVHGFSCADSEFLQLYRPQFLACLEQALAIVTQSRVNRLQQKKGEKAKKFLQALKLFHCQNLRMTEIADSLGLRAQDAVTRLLKLKEFRADVRQQLLLLLCDRVLDLAKNYSHPDRLITLEQHIKLALDEQITQVIKEAGNQSQTAKINTIENGLWLAERANSLIINRERCTTFQPALAKAIAAVANLQVGKFKICLITTGSLTDDQIYLPQAVVDLPEYIPHFYVWVEVLEEEDAALISGFLSYQQLREHQTKVNLQSSADWNYQIPVSWFENNPDRLLLYLRCLEPERIALPAKSENTQILSTIQTRKAKILVILGDESGLDFKTEKQAVTSLESLATITFIGWQPHENITELKTKIVQAIASKAGWDILFFAGHSNETNLTGGEFGIAPNTALLISEIEQSLTIAKSRGLQVAIFNSCKGLSIANKLIDLGLSQVAVMREPIHNRVAEEFFLQFVQALGEYKDVHESLLAASKYLKLEKNFTYPSAYLIPSLFRHPEAELFRLQPFGIKEFFKSLKPNRQEAIALSVLLIISLLLPVQSFLLQRRVLVQAFYRQITRQVASVASPPPVLLVQIDEESIRKAKISNPKPMNRQYLASLVERLTANNARVVGIDYLLDRPQEQGDRILAKSIQTAVGSSSSPTLFVFSATSNDNVWLRVLPEIASLHWSLEGEIDNYPWYMELLPHDDFKSQPWHFASLLALGHQLQQIPNAPQPKIDFVQQISDFFKDGNNWSLD